MKLQLNREYAMRHLGVAVLFLGLCGWFLYDGTITYPNMDDTTFSEQILHGRDRQGDFDKLKQEAINRQYQFAGICGIAALLIALGVGRCRLQTLEWDDEKMCGSLTAQLSINLRVSVLSRFSVLAPQASQCAGECGKMWA